MGTRKSAKQSSSDLNAIKVPPHSVEAEQSVLGGLMLDNLSWDKVISRIAENDFYNKEHRLIFNAIESLANQSKPFDVLTLSDALKTRGELEHIGGEVFLFELAKNTPSAANIA
ncbi:MAG: replicative DNA helicase, partial [Gammaproteobacteria bacterium]|nr:replicative DNA helicase [Gammaproteobacteria bacterium]